MVFDEIADEYDRNRPVYPGELVDQACRVAGLGGGDRVLEIGCGSGQLTRGLLARGLRLTAVEPGTNLLTLARQNLDGAGSAEFINARFEDAPLPLAHYRAVFSASAIHDLAQGYAGQLFRDVQIAVVPRLIEQTGDGLNAVLRTMSFYARLSPDQRQALEHENVALHERLGRPIRASVTVALVTARHAGPGFP